MTVSSGASSARSAEPSTSTAPTKATAAGGRWLSARFFEPPAVEEHTASATPQSCWPVLLLLLGLLRGSVVVHSVHLPPSAGAAATAAPRAAGSRTAASHLSPAAAACPSPLAAAAGDGCRRDGRSCCSTASSASGRQAAAVGPRGLHSGW